MLKNNKTELIESIYHATLSPELFNRFTQFIQQRCGIHIKPSKKNMLEGRLRKRMRQLLLPTFEDYAHYLFSRTKNTKEEMIHFLDAITTNKTGFFRETPHFDYLVSEVLPEFIRQHDRHRVHTFRIWSAGCSSGEEPYTLAIVLNEFAEKNPTFSYAILATDLSKRALNKAKTAVYDNDQLEEVTPEHLCKYFVAARTGDNNQLRVASALRETIMFRRLNFMDSAFPIREPLQVIFCRNVMMYFDRATREQLVNRFTEKLCPGGYLFTGHSESLAGFPSNLKPVSSSVYQKPRH
jgi:chemotaxis protein methyltransferase CheR